MNKQISGFRRLIRELRKRHEDPEYAKEQEKIDSVLRPYFDHLREMENKDKQEDKKEGEENNG